MSSKFERMLPWPEDDFSRYGAITTTKLGKIQSYVGKVMDRNWVSIPHVTHHDDIDISDLEARRVSWNQAHPEQKRSILPALMKAVVEVLKQYPQFNCSLAADGETVTQKHYYHIGFAADVPSGLVVPVVKDCDTRTLQEIADDIADKSARAKGKGLPMSDMSGGCFTISSLGHIGGTGFSPIINAPEVAILGVCKARPVFVPDADGQPVSRLMLPVSLSYDHRVINGADAARFMLALGAALGDFQFT
jgi:pyruvate dehydrogenase E2 component (dihydrolipoamide acetyltransferase)